jgi:hypothetical protein
MTRLLVLGRLCTYFLFPFALDNEAIRADHPQLSLVKNTLDRWFGLLEEPATAVAIGRRACPASVHGNQAWVIG